MSQGNSYERWADQDFGTVANQCVYCVHRGTVGEQNYCTAFPGGIPDVILTDSFDHRRPFLDDAGQPADQGVSGARSITFAPRDDVSKATLDRLYRRLDAIPAPA